MSFYYSIRKTAVLLSFLIIVLNNTTHSQVSTSVFDRITNKDGLSQSTINHIIQDRNGFMWFATFGGLNKYNGYSFKVYRHNEEDTTSLSSDGTIYLMEDSSGYIWVVNNTNAGLDRFNPFTEKSTRFTHNPMDKTSIGSNEVYMVIQDRKGEIWVCARNGLNLLVEGKGNKESNAHFMQFNFDSERPFKYVFENKFNQLLLFSDYLYFFNRETQRYQKSEVKLANSDILSLVEDKAGNLYLGTEENGIIKLLYNKHNKKYQRVEIDGLSTIPNIRNFLLLDNKNRLWIGTESKGLFRYNLETEKLINYLPDKLDEKTISDRAINSLYLDDSGILWIGTVSQGVCKYDMYRKEFIHFKSIPGNPNSLSGNVISSIHSINPKELWVGHDLGGGVTRIIFNDNASPQFIHYKHDPENINSIAFDNIISLVQRKNGEVWLGSPGGSLSRITPEVPGSEIYSQIKRFFINKWTFSLFEDSDGILWGGTWGTGLWRYNDSTGKFVSFMPDANNPLSLGDDVVWAIGEDQYKNIWIGGHSKGLSIIPAGEKLKENPVFINFKYKKDEPLTLSNNTINAFCLDHTGTMWIATAGGVNKVIDSQNRLKILDKNCKLEFHSFKKKDGLPDEGITGVVEDFDGNLWLSTSNGISKFTVADSTFTNYFESDGLQSNEFWHNAYFINSEGRIFFGGPNGFNAFYPDKIKTNPILPKVVLTDFKLFNQSIKPGQKIENEAVFSKPIYETSFLELSYKSNMITFEFAALHYALPAQNQYAYKMEGFDEDWIYAGNNRTATYTNLDPGKYTFRVKASNNDSLWNEEGTSIEIEILPPWWATWWFRFFFVLLILAAIAGYVRWRTYTLKIRSLNLEKLVKERTYELIELNEVLNKNNVLLRDKQAQIEEQADELEMQKEEVLQQKNNLQVINEELNKINTTKDKLFSIIAHDLRSPFTIILGFSKMLIEKIDSWNKEKQKKHAGLIFSSSQQAYNLLDNLLLWARTQQQAIQFKPEQFILSDLINDNIKNLNVNAKSKSITLKAINKSDEPIFADKNMVQIVLLNLINNAIKFSFENSTIEITSEKKEENWLISVKDSGVGIDEASQTKIFQEDVYTTGGTNGEKGSGLGLVLCKEFIEVHHGKIWFESKKEIGTTFNFTIPVVKDRA